MLEAAINSMRLQGALSSRLRLAIEAHLFPDGDNGIADLVDRTLQLVFCHNQNA